MLVELYNNLLNDKNITNIYNNIGLKEDENGNMAYHNYNHILNVTNLVETILSKLNYDNDFIIKAKIACLFHDVGALQGKEGHALRSYEFTKKYFQDNNINFDDMELVLEAIKIHSDGFDTDNIIALALILADKLDIKKTRISASGKNVYGNRQYSHIEDIIINIDNNYLSINFITDNKENKEELEEYYFTKKVFKAIDSFSKKLNLDYEVFLNNDVWNI